MCVSTSLSTHTHTPNKLGFLSAEVCVCVCVHAFPSVNNCDSDKISLDTGGEGGGGLWRVRGRG